MPCGEELTKFAMFLFTVEVCLMFTLKINRLSLEIYDLTARVFSVG